MKNSDGETPLALATKLGNEIVAKALKCFGMKPQTLVRSVANSTAEAVAPVPTPEHHTDAVDESNEPARSCFPDFVYDRSSGSSDRTRVTATRLLELARKMMQACSKGNAPLMRQSLLEWNACMSQCVQPVCGLCSHVYWSLSAGTKKQ